MSGKKEPYFLIVALLGLILIIASLSNIKLDGPDSWLIEWTAWAAKYVALVIAAQKVWKFSDVLIARLART
jgi:hypothetical protein